MTASARQPRGGIRGRGTLATAAACALLLAAGWATAAASPPGASPSLVQAGFITKFPLFVTWPAGARAPGAPLVIGVLGDTPVLADLQQLARYTKVDGSAVEVRALRDAAEGRFCHIVFIAADQAPELDRVLAELAAAPVLTVADSPGFARDGVHINFYVEDERVRFELNQKACERAGLGLSFRLRNVARLVE